LSDLLKILLVEDNPEHAELIRAQLRRVSGAAVRLDLAERLAEGLAKIDGDKVDAVLLDMMLPDSRGIETVSRVHAHAPSVPIVVLTSAEGESYGIEALQHGAEDYIFKGRMDGQGLMRSIRYAIERSGRRRAELALDAARQELLIAKKIQQSLYPRSAPPMDSLEIAGFSQPAESVGGDYFDYIQMPGGRLGVPIGDVSGHGIGPALLMAETRAAVRTLGRTCPDVGEALTLANRILLDGVLEGRFVTLLFISIDPVQRTLTYAGAGHPDGLLIDRSGEIVTRLPSSGFPLGVVRDEIYPVHGPIPFEAGQTLLLYTDGLLDASPPGAVRPFGADRVMQVVRRNLHRPAAQILEALHQAVAQYSPGKPTDDITAVVVKSL